MPSQSFSVIIPVYNDESNLRRCLDSVLSQTYIDFECLLINDGSTDNCPAICDSYANKDSRVRVVHKANEGISKTRQFGINNAIGEYTFFVDSDDWIEASFLADIKPKIEENKPDVIFMDFFDENTAGNERRIHQKPSSLDFETVLSLVLEGKLFSCLWNVLIKKELYVKNNVNFVESINYGEDSLFIIELLLNNPKVDYLPGAYYHHTFNHNSFTRKSRKKRYMERVNFLNLLPSLLIKYERDDLSKHNFFPLIDKYEMLSSGLFTKKEYQSLFQLSITPYYRKRAGLRKYIILVLAETACYIPAKFIAVFMKKLGRNLSGIVHRNAS